MFGFQLGSVGASEPLFEYIAVAREEEHGAERRVDGVAVPCALILSQEPVPGLLREHVVVALVCHCGFVITTYVA